MERKMTIENLTLKELREINKLFANCTQTQNEIWEIGKNYFIRTVTMHLVGKLKVLNQKELLLEKASWIADSGRFHDALKTGEFEEIEPFINDLIINRESIVDATLFNHSLPENQK